MRSSILCCAAAAAVTFSSDLKGYDMEIPTKYMGYKKYTNSNADDVELNGVTHVTYNAVVGKYMAITDDGLFSFDIDVGCEYGVRQSSESAVMDMPGSYNFDGMIAVESAVDAEKQLFMFIGHEGITWWDEATNVYHRQTAESLSGTQIPDMIASELFDDSSDVGLGGIASVKAKDGHYVAYISDVALPADAECGSGDGQCFRIVVNEVDAEGKRLIPLHQIYYESDSKRGISDIILVESANGILYGIILEKNRSIYLVGLKGPGVEELDVSSCSSLSSSPSAADVDCSATKKVRKMLLHTFSRKRFPFQFSTLSVVFRDQSGSLLDNDFNLLLVATNNNVNDIDRDDRLPSQSNSTSNSSPQPTYFIYFKLNLSQIPRLNLPRIVTRSQLKTRDFLRADGSDDRFFSPRFTESDLLRQGIDDNDDDAGD